MDHLQNVLSYFDQQQPLCAEHDRIPKDLYREFGVKAGLRDETGKGVLAGLTNISDIRAFQYVDGVKHPADGQLLYRGYDVKDLINGSRGRRRQAAARRRRRPARKAGLGPLPAYIREVDDENLHAMALVENIQREDLNAIEIALGMQRLIDECNLTQEALSEKVGKKRSTVSNYMRLLKLPNEVQLALKEGLISMGHAKAIAGAPEELQLRLLKKCIRKGLSVRQIEELVRALTDPAAKPAAPAEDEEYPESYARLVEQLEKFFSQEISIKRSKNGGGRIVIDFSDDRDIDRFIEKFEKRGASAEIRNNK